MYYVLNELELCALEQPGNALGLTTQVLEKMKHNESGPQLPKNSPHLAWGVLHTCMYNTPVLGTPSLAKLKACRIFQIFNDM